MNLSLISTTTATLAFLLLLLFNTCFCFEKLNHLCYTALSGQGHVTALKTKNANIVVDRLLNNVAATNFATSTSGNDENTVYGLLQCRSDVDRPTCARCAKDAVAQLKTLCKISKRVNGGVVWFDYCFLRYDTQKFFGVLDTGFSFFHYNSTKIADKLFGEFQKKVGTMMVQGASEKAAKLPGSRGFGTAETALTDGRKVYGMTECTRDLSPGNCSQCLDSGVKMYFQEDLTNGTVGLRMYFFYCTARYEMYPFF